MNDNIYYIDTNVLVYAHSKESDYYFDSKKIATELLENKQLVICEIVIKEFYSIITDSRKILNPWETKKASEYILILQKSAADIHFINSEIMESAFKSVEQNNIKRYSIYDHLIAYSMKYYGVDRIITTNIKDFQKYDFIKEIIEPEREKKKEKRNNFISYGKQWIDEDDITAVTQTLKSDYLTQGPKISEFEKMICDLTKAKYCVAVANGTAALHIAVSALNIEKNSEGITSTNTFVATSNSMIYNNIRPVFADIDDRTYNIDPTEIEKHINPKTRLLIPVHFAGQPADMFEINALAKRNKLFTIEDASHAVGSRYENGSYVGSCEYSDMTIFSFHPVKTLTTGEGGAITTNNESLYKKLLMLRTHGITKDPKSLEQIPGPWYYEMHMLGYNYRITDMQAALGISQLSKLDKFIKRRREIVERYNEAFQDIDWITTPYEREKGYSAFHLYVLQINFEKIGKSRENVMEKLREKNIGTQVHYIPVHTQPYYQKNFGYKKGDFPVAESYYERALSIPLYPKMKDEDVDHVIENILRLSSK